MRDVTYKLGVPTNVANRALLLWAEPDAVMRTGLPQIAMRTIREIQDARVAAPAAPSTFEDTIRDLTEQALGAFLHEGYEATAIAAATTSVSRL